MEKFYKYRTNKTERSGGVVMDSLKIRKAIKEIEAASYLANDVWDDTNGVRKYHTISVPVVELNTVIEILQKHIENDGVKKK